jgi:hypothetical protein
VQLRGGTHVKEPQVIVVVDGAYLRFAAAIFRIFCLIVFVLPVFAHKATEHARIAAIDPYAPSE